MTSQEIRKSGFTRQEGRSQLPNHLMGHRQLHLQLCSHNVSHQLLVRRDVVSFTRISCANRDAVDAHAEVISSTTGGANMDFHFKGELTSHHSRPLFMIEILEKV